MLRYLFMAALIAVPCAAIAAPLQPTGKWHLFYQESNCAAERRFGDHMLGLQPSPLGKTMRLAIVGPGRVGSTRQLDSLIELSDGGPPIKSSSLVFATPKKGMRGITTVLPLAEAERVSKSTWLRISTLGTAPKSRRATPSRDPIFSGEFALGSTAALTRELNRCLADLQRHWGMVDRELPEPAKPAEINSKGMFHSNDYPEQAWTAEQGGTTKFLLMIDEKGALLDCVIEETSGVASIDAMGCQVIKERAKIKPALDAEGKPVKSIRSFTVSWRLS